MLLVFEDRPADSPLVERIWRSRSERAGAFVSVAASHWEMVVTRLRGKTMLTVRGPETHAALVDCPADGEWLGIRFKLGAFMPEFPARNLRDRNDLNLARASKRTFWLDGSAWEYPSFDNADVFVNRLARAGLLTFDPAVASAVLGGRRELSLRSTQRHFLHASGITLGTMRQIERARHATHLLKQGVSILDTIHQSGYYDQAHMTRSLTYLIGQTPGQIVRAEEQLSFLYKTEL